MAVTVTLGDLLEGHVGLDIECLDRIYLNGYVPNLQVGGQVVAFMTRHLGLPIPSPAVMEKIGTRFRRAVQAFAQAQWIPVVKFARGERKLEVMRRYLTAQAKTGRGGVAAIGYAQEIQNVYASSQRPGSNGVPWVLLLQGRPAGADGAGRLSWQVSVDSTISRAHIHAAGARRDSADRVDGEPDHHALGRSRGGWGTKTHAVIDQHRGVLAFLVTPGQDGDSPQMIPVLQMIRVERAGPGRPRTRPQRVLADKAYSSKANRAWLRAHRIPSTIPVPADQVGHRQRRGSHGGRPPAFDPDTHKDRHAVECGFNILKHHRGFATRYDKLAVRFAATVHVASIDHWLKRLP